MAADARSRPSDTTAAGIAAALEAFGKRVRAHGSHYRAQCPVCNGRDLTVWFKDGDYGPPLIQCHRVCCSRDGYRDEFSAALGLAREALAPPKLVKLPPLQRRSPPGPPRPPKYLCNTNSVRAALPKRAGSAVRRVADDLADLTAERREAGDYRAQPYTASFGAARLGLHRQSVQRALRWLVAHDVLVARPLWKRPGDVGSPKLAYRFNPSVLRGEASGPTVARPVEAPPGVTAIAGREPLTEGERGDGVSMAQLVGPLVTGEVDERRFRASRSGAADPFVVAVGHAINSAATGGVQTEAA